MTEALNITVTSLKEQGYVECPRCREYHNNLLNPKAITSKTRGNASKGTQETVTNVSHICDKCCDSLLEAFSDDSWKLFWPTISDEEASDIVTRIKEARRAQVAHYQRAV